MGQGKKEEGRFIPGRPTKAILRQLTSIFLSITVLLSAILMTDPTLGQGPSPPPKSYRLMIEDFHSGKVLWQSAVKAGDEIIYLHNHSVYGVEVRHKYVVSPERGLVLDSVRSLPFVLFDPYPGYSLPYQEKQKDYKGMIEVKINRRRNKIIMVVGDKLTRKRFITGNNIISLQDLNDGVSVITLMLKKFSEK